MLDLKRVLICTGLGFFLCQGLKAQADLSVANELYEQGRYESVLAHLGAYEIRKVPDLLLEADAHHKLKDYEQAAEWYTQVLARDEDNLRALMRRGAAYLELGQFGWALKDVKDALKLSPTDPEANFYMGNICYDQQDMRNAVKYYKLAREYRPDYPQAIYMLGAAKAMQGDKKAAARAFLEVLEEMPQAIYNLAVVSLESDSYEESVTYFEQLEGMDFKLEADYYFLKAEALFYNGDKLEACLAYQQAAEMGDEEAAAIYDDLCLKNKTKPDRKKRETMKIEM